MATTLSHPAVTAATDRRTGARRGPRVLVLTHYFSPEPNFITAEVVEALAQHARTTVICPHPNYPLGRFYPGTRWWLPRRTVERGVVVWRIPVVPDHSGSVLRRGLCYGSYAILAALLAPFVAGRADTVWVYQGQFLTGLAALWFRWIRRSRVVFTCADLWPESFVAAGVLRPGLITRLSRVYSAWLNRWADLHICSTRGTVARIRSDGVDDDRLRCVPIWVPGLPEVSEEPVAVTKERRIVYAGNLGPSQRLETLIHAAARLRELKSGVEVDLYGSGAREEALRQLAEELGATNVHFRGRVPAAEAFAHSRLAFAQYVALAPSPLFEMTIPSKLAVAFAAGSPLLYGLGGESATLAEESGGGIRFDPDDPTSLVAAVESLLRRSADERARMRRSMTDYYRRHFSRGRLLEEYVELLLGRKTNVAAHA